METQGTTAPGWRSQDRRGPGRGDTEEEGQESASSLGSGVTQKRGAKVMELESHKNRGIGE